ncbi:hypothetical protein ACJMK2_044193 [Sinanodonta woodiana]|uniref:La-related protein 6 n=1 Tax=Sinanodonta woodiana TaxID=1069815 RepID=A0ABD3W2F7_SINWO
MSATASLENVPEIREVVFTDPCNGTNNSLENVNTISTVAPVLRLEEIKDSEFSSGVPSEDDVHSQHDASDEPDKGQSEKPEFVAPDDELRDKIIKQVEFYFSDANILKDAFLLKHVRRNKSGYVSIKLITSFKKVKSLTKDYRVVTYSLRQSDKLEVNEEGKKVRRKDPLPDYDETTPSRSVFAVNLPMENPAIENVAELFSKCGEVALIRILRPGKPVPQDLIKHVTKHPEIVKSVCTVVEFENHESAKKACETMNNTEDWRNGMRVELLATKNKEKKNKESKSAKEQPDSGDEGKENPRKKRTRGKKKKNLEVYNNDSSCYSSSSEIEPTSRPVDQSAASPNLLEPNRLSPRTSPRSSPRLQRTRGGPKGKSPLVDATSPGSSPRNSPRSSPEVSRKKYDYSSGDSSPSSPWIQRRMKAAQEKSPLASRSPGGSPLIGRRTPESSPRMLDMEGVVRLPRGPDGTKGFHLGRGKPRAATFS